MLKERWAIENRWQQGIYIEPSTDCQVSPIVCVCGCDEDVKHTIAVAWQKWKELAGVVSMVCDRKMPTRDKWKVYKTMMRPVLIYGNGAEFWSLWRKEELLLEKTGMPMLRWILGGLLRNRKRSEVICREVGVASITDKDGAWSQVTTAWSCGTERRIQQHKTNHESKSLRKTKQRKKKEEMDRRNATRSQAVQTRR